MLCVKLWRRLGCRCHNAYFADAYTPMFMRSSIYMVACIHAYTPINNLYVWGRLDEYLSSSLDGAVIANEIYYGIVTNQCLIQTNGIVVPVKFSRRICSDKVEYCPIGQKGEECQIFQDFIRYDLHWLDGDGKQCYSTPYCKKNCSFSWKSTHRPTPSSPPQPK